MDAVWQAAGPDSRLTPDGGLRIEQRLGSLEWQRATIYDRWAVISDARTGATIVDCRNWPRSRAVFRDDGTIHIRLSLATIGSDTLYAVDPARRSYRDVGLTGPERPLAEMQQAIDTALPEFGKWIIGTGWETRQRYISPDGTMRIDETIIDNERVATLRTAKAFDTATGASLFDLDETETCSRFREWEGESCASIGVSSLAGFETLEVWLNAARGTWRLGGEGEERLRPESRPEIMAKLAAAEKVGKQRHAKTSGETAERLLRVVILLFGVICGGALVALYDAAFGPMLEGMGI